MHQVLYDSVFIAHTGYVFAYDCYFSTYTSYIGTYVSDLCTYTSAAFNSAAVYFRHLLEANKGLTANFTILVGGGFFSYFKFATPCWHLKVVGYLLVGVVWVVSLLMGWKTFFGSILFNQSNHTQVELLLKKNHP